MDDPIEALLEYLRSKATHSKKAANELARIENAEFYEKIPKKKRGEKDADYQPEHQSQPQPHPVQPDTSKFNPETLKKKVRVQ